MSRRGRTWYRVEFADGGFIYLPFSFRNVKILVKERKEHGKITSIIRMGRGHNVRSNIYNKQRLP